jgi:hypothetical protein
MLDVPSSSSVDWGFDMPAAAFEAHAQMIGVPERHGARVESAVGVELIVPQELHFGAGRLALVAEFTRDAPAVSLQRLQRLAGSCLHGHSAPSCASCRHAGSDAPHRRPGLLHENRVRHGIRSGGIGCVREGLTEGQHVLPARSSASCDARV